jgi:hypothetical protein
MNRYTFRGPPTNLGRFGAVRDGDPLVLTDQEADNIAGDERFEFLEDGQRPPSKNNLIAITAQMTGEERKKAEASNRLEMARQDKLKQSNDEDGVALLEIKGMSFEALSEMADAINEEAGQRVIDNQRLSKAELIKALVNYRRKLKGEAEAKRAAAKPKAAEAEAPKAPAK